MKGKTERGFSWRGCLNPGVMVLLTLTFLGFFWLGWNWSTRPPMPIIVLEGLEEDLAQAIRQAQQRVKQDRRNAAHWGELGRLLRGAVLTEDAADCFAVAARLEPTPLWDYLRGESLSHFNEEAAVDALREAAKRWEQTGLDDLSAWLRLGELLLARGELDEAAEQFELAARREPRNPVVALNRGLIAKARGQWQDARTHLQTCLQDPATRQRASVHLAAVLRHLNDADGARQCAEKAATLPPDRGWYDPHVAECIRRAVGTAGRFRLVEQLEAQQRWREAVQMLQEMTTVAPEVRVFVGLGKNYLQLGDLDAAEESFETALQMEPTLVQARYQLAKIAWSRAEQFRQRGQDPARAEQLARARGQAEAIIQRKADHAMAHMLLGLVQRATDQKAQGLQSLRTAVRCAPDEPEACLQLGEALLEEGLPSEARPYLQQVERVGSSPEQRRRAREALQRLAPPG